MVRWLRWHCPPDTGFEIRALAVWGRARYLSVTEAPHNTNFHTWIGKKQFCFFQTAETGNRTPDSGVKGSGANHYPRAPARFIQSIYEMYMHIFCEEMCHRICRRYPWQHDNYYIITCLCYHCYLRSSIMFYRSAVSVNITLCNARIRLFKE